MDTLQFVRHLSVPMSVPTVKVWRPEELPANDTTVKVALTHIVMTCDWPGAGAHLYRPIQSPLSMEVSCGPVWSNVARNSS